MDTTQYDIQNFKDGMEEITNADEDMIEMDEGHEEEQILANLNIVKENMLPV